MNYEDYVNERLRGGWGGDYYAEYDAEGDDVISGNGMGLTRAVKSGPMDPAGGDPDDPDAIVAVPGFGFLPR